MHQDREKDGSFLGRLLGGGRPRVPGGRGEAEAVETWTCCFCASTNDDPQFWCGSCARCRYDGELLPAADVGRHWERHAVAEASPDPDRRQAPGELPWTW